MCFALSGVADGLGDALGEAEVKPMWPRLVEAVKRMRKIFAGRVRAAGRREPTRAHRVRAWGRQSEVKTLHKLIAPFGLELTVRRSWAEK